MTTVYDECLRRSPYTVTNYDESYTLTRSLRKKMFHNMIITNVTVGEQEMSRIPEKIKRKVVPII